MAPLLRGILVCAICNRLVSLESCKIDENGQAVHESCYIVRTLQSSRRERPADILAQDDRRREKSPLQKPEI
jgi:hypothetical protein